MVQTFGIDISPLDSSGVVVTVTGDIDLFTTPDFKRAVAEAMSRDTETLVIDLSRSTFMDSSSLGVLIGAHRKLARRGRPLIVVCDNEAILKVLRVTGLDGVFTVVGSVPDVDAPVGPLR